MNIAETMPSPVAKRIAPVIGEELKKKIKTAVKSKEARDKKVKLENFTGDEVSYANNNISFSINAYLGRKRRI